MKKASIHYHPIRSLPLLFVVAWVLSQAPAFAGMGMGWGDIGGEEPPAAVCPEPDFSQSNNGPFDRPLRLTLFSSEDLIVADYRLGKMFLVNMADIANPKILFDVDGRPMGVAVAESRQGKLIFSGNDSTDKVDVYQETRRRKGGRKTSLNDETVKYVKRFSFPFSKKDKVQALDIEVDQATKKVFVVDGLKKEIQVYDFRGRLLSSLGGFGDLTMPKGLALDPATEEVFVSDYGDAGRGVSAAIKVFDYSGKLLRSITGEFGRPHGVDVVDERLFFVDSLLGQVLEFDRNQGGLVAAHGCVGSDAGHMRLPRDLIYNASLGAVFVADFRNQRVTRVDVKGISP